MDRTTFEANKGQNYHSAGGLRGDDPSADFRSGVCSSLPSVSRLRQIVHSQHLESSGASSTESAP